jgi:hypothetical protein
VENAQHDVDSTSESASMKDGDLVISMGYFYASMDAINEQCDLQISCRLVPSSSAEY